MTWLKNTMGKLRILSRSQEAFDDRITAAKLLGAELKKYSGQKTVVLGIPRGGVVIASLLATELGADLDIVLSRKLGAPGNPELAIGAVAEDGKLFLHGMVASQGLGDSPYIKQEKARQMEEIARRVQMYRKVRSKVGLENKVVIVTDDGLATGATMQAALWSARHENPGRLIAAVPVSPEDTAEKLAKDADELIVLRIPAFFGAVGQFYRKFEQVEDEEVLSILKNSVRIHK